ncbi:MAG: nucleotidyltransferase domain-containing protein [Thermoleophilaceae bacterium]
MDLANPHRLIAHPLDGSVLTVLAGTTRPLTGREVARLAPEGSQPGVWKALTRLSEQGLVDRQEAGNAILYSLNRHHLAAPAIDILTGLRRRLLANLRDAIAGWAVAPHHASMFGSAARGEADIASDIDLVLVRPRDVAADDRRWRDQVDELSDAVHLWTGNRAGISEIDEQKVERLRKESPPIVTALRSDAVTLFGPDATDVFRPDGR